MLFKSSNCAPYAASAIVRPCMLGAQVLSKIPRACLQPPLYRGSGITLVTVKLWRACRERLQDVLRYVTAAPLSL